MNTMRFHSRSRCVENKRMGRRWGRRRKCRYPFPFSLPFLFHIPGRRNEGILKKQSRMRKPGRRRLHFLASCLVKLTKQALSLGKLAYNLQLPFRCNEISKHNSSGLLIGLNFPFSYFLHIFPFLGMYPLASSV